MPTPNTFAGDNLGGLLRLRLVKSRDVLSFPDSALASVVLKSGIVWAEIRFSSQTAAHKEVFAEERQGVFYKQEINFFVPQDRPEVKDFLQQYARFGLLVEAHSDRHRKIVGTPSQPLRLVQADYSTREKASGKVGHEFSIKGDTLDKALYYTPTQYLLLNDAQYVLQNNADPIIL
jgi:hypothetical protein